MVLNKTNIKRLERACGTDEVEEWVGKQVTLFVDEVDFQGDLVQAIRIKAQPPAVAPKRVAGKPVGGQEMEDDIPW